MRRILAFIPFVIFCSSLVSQTSATTDSVYLTISKELEEIVVVQKSSSSPTTINPTNMMVDMNQLSSTPKFLGTSDPIRYLQSLSGIQTNNETSSGIHIQGCDDYQSLVSINGSPVYYPNHLLGLFSTFNSAHFKTMQVEQAIHDGRMENRIGGLVNLDTHRQQPNRFSLEGNLGLVNTDLTLTIPCGKKSALWLSGRTSYINLLYSKWLRFEGIQLGYHFQDYNLTYSYHPTSRDELLVTGFYSRDKLNVEMGDGTSVIWQNVLGNIRWSHQFDKGEWKTLVDFSGFNSRIRAVMEVASIKTNFDFASVDVKSFYQGEIADKLSLVSGLDYHHYLTQPLQFDIQSESVAPAESRARRMAEEVSLYANISHSVTSYWDYSIGLHGSIYHIDKSVFGSVDPRVSTSFHMNHHHITVHGGLYCQYFHKSGLTNGGLPTDFFFLSDSTFRPERAIAANISYKGSFLQNQYVLSAEIYYKQIYHIVESTANILELVNQQFAYESGLLNSSGRNYGLNLMFQRTRGIVTGHVSYSLGWSRRKIPQLDGSEQYIYAASHERRHDLNIVLNARLAKRWDLGAMFVLASGLPYTKAEELYLLNGKMYCRYSTFNGAHMPLYNRLDLSCSCDIIQKKDHVFGINISLYNVYCHKNAQFVVYRERNLRPVLGTALSTIVPSISLYGKF